VATSNRKRKVKLVLTNDYRAFEERAARQAEGMSILFAR
jgi:hypothetical protein